MHHQLYLTGKLGGNPMPGQTSKGKLMVKVLLEAELVRETRPGEFTSEAVAPPVTFSSYPAEQVRDLKRGDQLTIGCHLQGTKFQPDQGAVKHGVQIIADAVFLPAKEGAYG
jgi:hypothetical protein